MQDPATRISSAELAAETTLPTQVFFEQLQWSAVIGIDPRSVHLGLIGTWSDQGLQRSADL